MRADQIHAPVTFSWGNGYPSTHSLVGCVVPRAYSGAMEEQMSCFCREISSDFWVIQTLFWLRHQGSYLDFTAVRAPFSSRKCYGVVLVFMCDVHMLLCFSCLNMTNGSLDWIWSIQVRYPTYTGQVWWNFSPNLKRKYIYFFHYISYNFGSFTLYV